MPDQLLIIPEFILHKYVSNALAFIRADYAAQTDPTKSYLQRLIYNVGFERYDYLTQAMQVFLNNDAKSPRFLQAHLMWNMIKENVPSIHVTLPNESTMSGGNGMGMDEGFEDPIYIDTTYNEDGTVNVDGSSTPVFTRRYQGIYNIVIVSDNSNEVILIYHVLKALLTSLSPSLSLEGLQNISLGGNDLQIKSDLVPKNMYIKNISVSLQYDTSTPNIFNTPLYQSLLVNGTPVPTTN